MDVIAPLLSELFPETNYNSVAILLTTQPRSSQFLYQRRHLMSRAPQSHLKRR
jgi:hypothetical protein